MADATIDSELIKLIDNWGPAPYTFPLGLHPPKDAAGNIFTNPLHHNVAATAAMYPLGTQCVVPLDGSAGKAGAAVFRYLQVSTQDAVAIAAKTLCVPGSGTVWYQVSNDPNATVLLATGAAAVAIGLSAITDAYVGWFWTGGECPEQYVSGLGGTYGTDDTVIAGQGLMVQDLAADALGFGLHVSTTTAFVPGRVGWSLAADS